MPRWWPSVRDAILFLGGLAGVAHQTLLEHGERPSLLLLYGAMMGLPAILRSDERSKDDSDQGTPPT